jgi:ribosomal protein L16 Arg81 hydroxylase
MNELPEFSKRRLAQLQTELKEQQQQTRRKFAEKLKTFMFHDEHVAALSRRNQTQYITSLVETLARGEQIDDGQLIMLRAELRDLTQNHEMSSIRDGANELLDGIRHDGKALLGYGKVGVIKR